MGATFRLPGDGSVASARTRTARWRLACAIAVSTAIHAWLAGGVPLDVRLADAGAPPVELTAWLKPAQPALVDGSDSARLLTLPQQPVSRAESAGREDGRERGTQAARAANDPERAVPLPAPPAGPAYYAAHELDVYPSLLAPLAFGNAPGAVHDSTRGSVTVQLLIDALGVVSEVQVIAAEPPGLFEESTRTALAAARFSPGRRNGVPVGSRLTLSVDHGPGVLR